MPRAGRGASFDVSAAPGLAALALAPAVLFVAHFAYGAILPVPAVVLSALMAAGLVFGVGRRDLRRQVEGLHHLRPIAGLFAAVLAVALWSLTPWTPGGAHPVWAWAGLPGSAAIDRSVVVVEMVKLTGLAAAFGLGAMLGTRARRARALLGLILALGGVYALIALSLFLTGAQMGGGEGRLLGGFYTPNTAGTLLGVLALTAAAWLLRGWRVTRGETASARASGLAPAAAALLLFSACLILTASRSAIVLTALAAAGLVIADALTTRGRPWAWVTAALVLVGGAALLLTIGDSLFVTRLLQSGVSDEARQALTAAGWRAFLDSPLLGYGLGAYPTVAAQVTTAGDYDALSATTVLHHTYLQWLIEGGLIGALPMFAVVALILGVTAWKTVARPRNRTLLLGLLAASALVLAHALFDVSLHTPSFAGFWALLLGLGFALSQAPSSRG